MDSDSPLPAKRPRPSLNGNLQLTECVREFKLPQQFPSMAKKTISSDANNDRNKKRPICNTAVTGPTKTSINSKVTINHEGHTVPNIIRKIKLKGKDGRDLGEVNVQDLPQNIQGKTITLSKNSIMKPPEIVPPIDKSKGPIFGVLTPVNMLKTEKTLANRSPSLLCVNKDQKEIMDSCKDGKKTTIVEQKQMSMVMDAQGRPQVLVFQVRNNWHMVKLATSEPTQPLQNGKNIASGKLPMIPNCGKPTILQAKEYRQIVGGQEDVKNLAEKSLAVSKTCGTTLTSVLAKKWTQYTGSDSLAERHKQKASVPVENGESRPKIEISRIYAPPVDKPVSQAQPVAHLQSRMSLEKSVSPVNTSYSAPKYPSLRQDVMVVLPSDIPDSLDSHCLETVVTPISNSASYVKPNDLVKCGKITDNFKVPERREPRRDAFESRNSVRIPANDGEISNPLDILTKALSTVGDKELREKALKALADCGIGMERLVPICPPSEQRPVKDSGTQTPIFGVFEPNNFVYVTSERSDIQRIRPIERKMPQKIGHIIGNPQYQELALHSLDVGHLPPAEDLTDLAEMVETFVKGNDGASEVRSILAKPVSEKLVSELERDFQTHKNYDEDGLLNIHKAVIDENVLAVTRQLNVLRACNESPDLPTTAGATSLELAVRYEVCETIVKMLLDSGADPTSSEPGHDSALIIASKKSFPILKDLIHYVKTRKSLDNYDSLGFSALHYCAQNNDKAGVIELTRASADVNLQDRRSGRTPLFHAIENEHIEIAQILLDKGALPNIPSYSGHTVFALVEEGKHYNLTEALNRAGK